MKGRHLKFYVMPAAAGFSEHPLLFLFYFFILFFPFCVRPDKYQINFLKLGKVFTRSRVGWTFKNLWDSP
jgi:hypothetical protein